MAQRWLEECQTSHNTCQRQVPDFTPTRLLRVDEHEMAVVEMKGQIRPYLAPSYCWGKWPFSTLTKANYSNMLTSVSFDQIPRTFQDAVQVVRAFGKGFLWIDALCIIQDDRDDWARECVTMDSIYQNAVLTIAAQSTLRADQGFLALRAQHGHEHQTIALICGETVIAVNARVPLVHEQLRASLGLTNAPDHRRYLS